MVDRRAARDIDAAASWYEDERPGLGQEFLTELAVTYRRILAGPLGYQVRRADTRRDQARRFPYAVFFCGRRRPRDCDGCPTRQAQSGGMAASEESVIDIEHLSRDEKLELLGRIWDSLTASQENIPLLDWQRELLDRRIDELEREGPTGISPEQLFERLRGRNE